ncbi:MAG: dihydrolipoamide acetyltransferase family protein [Pirellulales bacterium]
MPIQITLPHLGENIDSGDILSILVSEGDQITVDQDLVEIETDKATMPVPSPEAGQVLKILVAEGDTVAVGEALLELEPTAAEASSALASPALASPQPTPASQPAAKAAPAQPPVAAAVTPPVEPSVQAPKPPAPQDPTPDEGRPSGIRNSKSELDIPRDGQSPVAAGPAVRRLARELGVDLRRVRPSGGQQRITADDVRTHVRATNEQVAADPFQGVTPPGIPESDGYGAVRRAKMSRMQQTIARTMLQSYTTIPQLTNFDDVDITELERIRQGSKDDYAATGMRLTTMPFLVKAVGTALRIHPVVNASIDEENQQILYKEYVNIGIAVDTERGLVVPVLRNADRKSICQLVRSLTEMAAAARGGDFSLDALRGGTFTISNLGAIGGTYSTPIINPPEVAILLAGRSRMMPQFIDGRFQPRRMMPLSITYDHRIVDGAAAARFLNDVKGLLANPGRLLLAP